MLLTLFDGHGKEG
jgi:hypothetical protein